MKSVMGFWLLIMVLALPVHAGQGTIEETETAIIVEYTGDAKDLPQEKAKPEVAAPAQKTPPAELQAAVAPGVEPPVQVKTNMSVRDAKANMSDTQRKKLEVRAAAKAARNSARQNQQEPD